MSRTLPRATGGMPAKFVSRMTFIAGVAPIDPPESVWHSIPRRGDVNVTSVAVQEEQRYCGYDVKLKFLRRKKKGGLLRPGCWRMKFILCGSGGALLGWFFLVAFPADTDQFGNAGLLHGDAIKDA